MGFYSLLKNEKDLIDFPFQSGHHHSRGSYRVTKIQPKI